MEALKRFRFGFEITSGKKPVKKENKMFLTGNLRELGSWDPTKALPMTWNKVGQRWTLLDLNLPPSFTYKYLMKNEQGETIAESIEHRTHDSTKIETLEQENGDGKVVLVWLHDEWDSSRTEINICRKRWWKEAVVYQIYPRSFCDSDGDGVGDLRGIISKLDYLRDLGVNVIWLCPVYKSPNDDNGYDISDYRDIHSEYGTMADWEQLLEEMHKRGMKLVMDLVVNHTSDEHLWFKESRKSKNNPYRDYYIWRPPNPKTGGPPNNWKSFFSGSTWEFDEQSGEYYLHLFSKKQPDLNWENPTVRQEVFDLMDFWLKKGIDGFRMDVINVLSKEEGFPDASEAHGEGPYYWGGNFFVNGPNLMKYLQEMKEKVLNKYNVMTVGETPFVTVNDAIRYATEGSTGVVNMLFHFELMGVDCKAEKWDYKPWTLRSIKNVMSSWQLELQGKGWNSLYLENHDQPRSVSRFGNDEKYRIPSAKMLATWLHFMQGTPYIYQGQEIGMTNVPFESIEECRDVETFNYFKEQIELKKDPKKILEAIRIKGRDNARTPMQWDTSKNAGFSMADRTWIAVNPNYTRINVQESLQDQDSVLHYYRTLLQLRKNRPVIVYGSFTPILEDDPKIYAYLRTFHEEQLLVLANFSAEDVTVEIPEEYGFRPSKITISNYPVKEKIDSKVLHFRPFETRVYEGIREHP